MREIVYKNTDFAEFFLFEHYVIAQLKEGALLEPKNNKQTIKIVEEHYASEPFVYIANRNFAYNVSPMTYLQSSEIENLIGICIVTQTEISQNTAHFEGRFFKKEFLVIGTIEEGINWAMDLVSSYKNKND
ncbi:hypothetical protein [Nonlabens antarcticus]|uniref:hypothetical protein n=1 Tax=Nonlabens antarcticus TaxID=392714 RepID=UPI00189151C4|nr:hypothetical protein [Nonlabens antarcticus]